MSSPKKILFVSCSIGAGHKRAAEALLLATKKRNDIIAEHIDLMDYSDWLVKKTVPSSYNFLARYLPQIYNLLYRLADGHKGADGLALFCELFQFNLRRFGHFIEQFKPDRIVCTHFLATIFLKERAGNAPVDFVITDYGLNRVILSPLVRSFFAPTEELADELRREGRMAVASGIPIHPAFQENKNIETAKKNFGLNKNWPTVLVMCGGHGLSDPTAIATAIGDGLEKANLVVVTGKNAPISRDKLASFKNNKQINFRLIRFTEKIDELMRASDVIITKPGGLTVTEALYLKKPLLLYSPIPGQEEANAAFVEKNNFGRMINEPSEALTAVRQIFSGQLKFGEPNMPTNAAETIVAEVMK